MQRVVIINDASISRGGATGLAVLQARMMAARGIEVTFVTGDREISPDLAASGIIVRSAGADPLMRSPRHVAATKGLWNKPVGALMSNVIAQGDTPDTVYHVHSWSKTLTAAVFAPLNRVAPRVFLHAHDFFFACPNGGYMDYQKMRPCARRPLSPGCLVTNCDKRSYGQKLWRVARQGLLSQSLAKSAPWGGILMIHPDMTDWLARAGWPRDVLRTLRNPAQALSPSRIPVEANRAALFIGRVEAEKGVEEAILAARAANMALIVVGDGPLRARLEAENPDLRFAGWLARDQIAEIAQEARVLVMPSRYPEPFGLVAAEASLSGLPVITSDSAFLGREIAAAGLGSTCNTRDVAAFAQELRRWAAMPDDEIAAISARAVSGQTGLCHAPEDWIDAILEYYAQALAQISAGVSAPLATP